MNKFAYYNEFDSKSAAWLRELIKEGLIADGEVDERSIVDVSASDLRGFSQHHFFAGIGGWSYALRLAGWPDDKSVWTASLPCQPFSAAGKGLGKSDDRHLLPHFLELVKECKPSVIFGEQVSPAIKHGWLDDLYAEMETCDYAVGSIIIGAHSVNSPHIRQRLYWVAHSNGIGCDIWSKNCEQEKRSGARINLRSANHGMVRTEREGLEGFSRDGNSIDEPGRIYPKQAGSATATSSIGSMANTQSQRWGILNPENNRQVNAQIDSFANSGNIFDEQSQGMFFAEVDWIYCRDNKYRPIESSIKPLVDGIPRGMVYSGDPCESVNQTQEARAMRLRGYGNAIVPQLAAQFIGAYMAIMGDR